MKNTSNTGKGNFEKNWEKAFEGAKLEPSKSLWLSIEAAIANEDAVRYRRGLAYYRWLVAAGLLLFASLLGYLAYRPASDTSRTLADGSQNDNTETLVNDSNTTAGEITTSLPGKDPKKIPDRSQLKGTTSNAVDEGSTEHHPIAVVSKSENNINDTEGGITPSTNQRSASFTGHQRSDISTLTTVLIPKKVDTDTKFEQSELPDKVNGIPIFPESRPGKGESLWAGIIMTPGYFDPNYQSEGVAQALQSADFSQGAVQPTEEHRTGFSMSFGVEVGMQISRRWQLLGGLHYLNNNVQSSTNTILDQRTPVFSSVAESLDLSNSRGAISFTQTELDNTFQFLSIPVQMGFMVLDKRFKLLVNAGVAGDIFLKNRITAVDNSLEPVTINPGTGAPYKNVYFNGLVGAQASFEFLPRYILSLEPRYKLAISDFATPDASYSSLPSSFGVGVGVKYVFK
jgi:hypothetical protein